MEDGYTSYNLTKELARLQRLHDYQKRSTRLEPHLELNDSLKKYYKTLEGITAIPSNFCDNVVKKEGAEEPFIAIGQHQTKYLQELKSKIDQIIVQDKQLDEIVIPEDLGKSVENLNADVEDIKRQLRKFKYLENCLEKIQRQLNVI